MVNFMIKIEDVVKNMPPMIVGEELKSIMTNLPDYNPDIINESNAIRLTALSNLYDIYIPSQMSLEIYNKLYLALLRSLQKKTNRKIVNQQQSQNYKALSRQEHYSVIGGSDSFTIIGTSGIGKSTAINKTISLITENRIIKIDEPQYMIIPCIVVQCPFDSSVKGMLLEILRIVDENLDTHYYESAIKIRATTDILIGSVSQIALNNIGMIIVDEIQNVANNNSGKHLISMLTQLINNSGVSICMVGTPEITPFFERAIQLARRSLGLSYSTLPFDSYFKEFCKIILSYQYTKNKINVTDDIIHWLYEHSNGIISVVVSLVHDAQEIAILNNEETVNLKTLNEAYEQRLSLLHNYIQPTVIHNKTKSKPKNKSVNLKPNNKQNITELTIKELVDKSKKEKINIIELLKENITIEVIKI